MLEGCNCHFVKWQQFHTLSTKGARRTTITGNYLPCISRYLSQLPVHSLSIVGSGVICDNIPGLLTPQRRLCRTHPDVMVSVVSGAKMGVSECQHQFRNNRWNCSTSQRDSSVFGKVMLKGEAGVLLFATFSAGTDIRRQKLTSVDVRF